MSYSRRIGEAFLIRNFTYLFSPNFSRCLSLSCMIGNILEHYQFVNYCSVISSILLPEFFFRQGVFLTICSHNKQWVRCNNGLVAYPKSKLCFLQSSFSQLLICPVINTLSFCVYMFTKVCMFFPTSYSTRRHFLGILPSSFFDESYLFSYIYMSNLSSSYSLQ